MANESDGGESRPHFGIAFKEDVGAFPSKPYDFVAETHDQTGRVKGDGAVALNSERIAGLSNYSSGDSAEGKWTLVRTDDHLSWELGPGRSVVGRSVNSEIQLADFPQISARHAMIEVTDSQCSITDLGSTNGTFVNGRLLSAGVACVIDKGDEIMLADIGFTLS